MGDDKIGLDGLEEIVHFVAAAFEGQVSLIADDVALRNARRPDIRPSVSGDLQVFHGVPVQMQVAFMQGGVLQVHVVIAGQGEYLRFGLDGENVLQNLVFLLQNPAGPDGVLLIPGAFLFNFRLRIRLVEQIVHEVLDGHRFPVHADAQAVEIGLQFMVMDGGMHVVERNIDQIAGDDVNVGHRFGQQLFDAVKSAVNVGNVNNLQKNLLPAEDSRLQTFIGVRLRTEITIACRLAQCNLRVIKGTGIKDSQRSLLSNRAPFISVFPRSCF